MPNISDSPFSDPSSQRRRIIQPGDPQFSVPAFSQQDVNMTQMLQRNFEALSSLSSQIARNLGGTESILRNSVDHYENMTTSAERLTGASRTQASQQREILEFSKAREEAMDRIRQAEEGTVDHLKTQFQLGGMLERQQITYIDRENQRRKMSIEDYRNLPESEKNAIRGQLGGAIADRQAGRFSLSQALQQLMHGNIPGALSELGQGLPGFGRLRSGLQMSGSAMTTVAQEQLERGAKEGGMGGLLTRAGGLGRLGMGGFVGTALPGLFTGAGIAGAAYETRRLIGQYQENLRTGMQTGLTGGAAVRESIGAGLRARMEGINPFDALSTRMAQEIARGIQSEGFAGPIRAAWQDSVTDVVKRTGMDAGTALQLMSTSVNQFGESASDFRANMTEMAEVSKDTNLSIKKITESLQDFQKSVFPTSGQAGAQAIVAPTAAFARAVPGVIRRGQAPAGISQNWIMLALRAGISPMDSQTTKAINQYNRVLDVNVAQLWRYKNSRPDWKALSVGDWVRQMEGINKQIFEMYLWPGVQAQDVIDLMNAVGESGKGLERKQAETQPKDIQKAAGRKHGGGIFGRIGHVVSATTRGIGHVAGTGGRIAGGALAGGLELAGVPASVADPLGRGFGMGIGQITSGGLVNLEHLPEYQNYGVGETRQNLIRYLKTHQLAGMSAAEQEPYLRSIRQAKSISQLDKAVDQTFSQYIRIDLTPDARKLVKVDQNTEPAARQRYHDSVHGRAGTQGMSRP